MLKGVGKEGLPRERGAREIRTRNARGGSKEE